MRNAAAPCSSLALAAALAVGPLAHAATPVALPHPVAAAVPASAASTPSPTQLADACPAQLAVQQNVSEVIAGWTPLNQQGNYPFVRVAFYPGPPAETSLIVPTVEYKGAAGLHDGWDLPRRAGGYWMTCSYGNTTATVARKLADDVDFCQADYDGRFLTLVVRRWSCGLKRAMAPALRAHPAPRPAPKPPARPPVRRVG
ncbi:MAG: STY0301 family protein [Burkholderiaceae bacterium]|jgi:hypothetical protein